MAPGAIVVIDGPAQAEALVRRLAGAGERPEILVHDSAAAAVLEAHGLEHTTTESLYDAKDCRAVKDDSLERTVWICRELDRLARAEAWTDAPASFEPFMAQVYSVRHLMDHLIFTAWRVERILAARPGRRVCYFDTAPETAGDDLFFRAESAWSRVLTAALDARGIPAERWPALPPPRESLGARAREALRGLKRRLTGLRNPAALAPAGGLLLLNRGYSVVHLAEEARRDGLEAVFLDPASLDRPARAAASAALERVWTAFSADPAAASRWVWNGIDLGPAAMPRLRRLVVSWAPRAEALFRSASAALAPRPAAAVAAAMNWREKIAAQACRANGVPFAVYNHGQIGTRHSELIYWNDMAFSDLFLVNGAAQEEYCRRQFPEARCAPKAVGLAFLDRVASEQTPEARVEMRRRLGVEDGRRLFVYVLNAARDYRFPQYHRESIANMLVERRIAALFARHPDADLILKLYGGGIDDAPLRTFVRSLNAPNIRILDKPVFSRMLPAADAFIADFPSTTTCEMAMTDKPIFFVNAATAIEWLPEARKIMGRRAEFMETLEEVDAVLGRALAAETLEPNADRSFAENYGVCRSDGLSARRAWSAIRERVLRA
ncbi:MAG: hypothetical protein HYV14_17075 [Elusimicrobia bacterium]|nr:hypothetical protein [Elusimicrobiota bacterium]